MTQWAFDVNILYELRKHGFRIRELPITWSDKEGSKINVKKVSTQVFFAVIQLRAINSPFKPILRPFKPVIGWLWRLLK
jgi:hypothetical protein